MSKSLYKIANKYLKGFSKDKPETELKVEDEKVSKKKEKKKIKKDKKKAKKIKKASSVTKMAMLYAEAKGDDKFLDDIEDMPVPEETTDLRDIIKDPGYSPAEEELYSGSPAIEKEKDDFGDPGEYMPSEEDEFTPSEEDNGGFSDDDKARRLDLIKARHQDWLDRQNKPMHSEEDENESPETELAETPEDELREQEELEAGELPVEFEDEDDLKRRHSAHEDFLQMGAAPWEKKEDEK